MFVDHIQITAKAGDGGDGFVSFRREAYVPKGGPDGGDGGRGGDVVMVVDGHLDSLAPYFYQPEWKARCGDAGQRRKRSGKSGADLELAVPPGTMVYRISGSGGEGEERQLVADLTQVGQRHLLCAGGKGGKGNVHFKSSTNRTPRESTPGGVGEEGVFFLELRKMADIGLVGFPNAGKSTLLRRLSGAKPKVANYPFTTLKPLVGVHLLPDERQVTIADIPGLIEGAHRNKGLGHEFLRHIMRCQMLFLVLDMGGEDERSPGQDLVTLRREIELYSADLAQKPWLIVANKMDLPGAREALEALRAAVAGVSVVPISALQGEGLEQLGEQILSLP